MLLLYFVFINVNELHWKTCNFLVRTYKNILIPEFPVSKMIKGRKLNSDTKRKMLSFNFNQFKERLKYKCKIHNTDMFIVDECYTSKTCGLCGKIVNVGGSKTFTCDNNKCSGFNKSIDRDHNGARNILLKNCFS